MVLAKSLAASVPQMTRRELTLSILLALNMACLLYISVRYGPLSGSSGASGDGPMELSLPSLAHPQQSVLAQIRASAPSTSDSNVNQPPRPLADQHRTVPGGGTTSIISSAADHQSYLAEADTFDERHADFKATEIPGATTISTTVANKLQNLATSQARNSMATAAHPSVMLTAAPIAPLAVPPAALSNALLNETKPRVTVAAATLLAAAAEIELMLCELQAGLRSPAEARSIVVMGSHQMLRRDKYFYKQAFEKHGFEVVDAAFGEWSPTARGWTGLLCLSLSDGDEKCMPKSTYPSLQGYQRVSRLPGLRKTLWNKDAFCYTLKTMTADAPVSMADFSFDCWVLPTQYSALMEWASDQDSEMKLAAARTGGESESQQYIVKPFSAGEGLGIRLASSTAELDEYKDMPRIVQPYLSEPLLINGRKFDIRTYVLVTSITPLRAYVFSQGLVRLASTPYQRNSKKRTSFLTNTSVNKKGTKLSNITWTMNQFQQYASAQNRDPAEILRSMRRAIGLTLLTAEPVFIRRLKKLALNYDCKHCYQLLGVDIIFDHAWKPHVIEINGEPSMKPSSEGPDAEYNHLKSGMVNGIAGLIYGQLSMVPNQDKSEQCVRDTVLEHLRKHRLGVVGVSCDEPYVHTSCITEATMLYLLELERERLFMGDFTKVYPTADGTYFEPLLQYYEQLFGEKMDPERTSGIANLAPGTWTLSKLLTSIEAGVPIGTAASQN